MKQTRFGRQAWLLFVLTMWILPLSGGCVSLQREDLAAFVEDLLRNAVAAFLL